MSVLNRPEMNEEWRRRRPEAHTNGHIFPRHLFAPADSILLLFGIILGVKGNF
jgi:hypothetical protein